MLHQCEVMDHQAALRYALVRAHVRPPPLLSSCTQRTRHITSHHITSFV